MVRVSKALLKEAGTGLGKTLSEILVCPLSKQPLRVCEESGSLVSDSIGVSFPAMFQCYQIGLVDFGQMCKIKDGIPCLVLKDGKILDADDKLRDDGADDDATKRN